MFVWPLLLLLLLHVHAAYAAEPGCPCITPAILSDAPYRSGTNQLIYQPSGSGGESFLLPASYGNDCAAHDSGQSPHCAGSAAPAWCTQSWCYVDRSNCNVAHAPTVFFPGTGVDYSYATCGSDSTTYSKIASNEISVGEVASRVEEYMCATKSVLEGQLAYWDGGAGDKEQSCSSHDSCPCTDCALADGWRQAVNLEDSVLVRPASCVDAAQFQDEQGYACRGWYGFDCSAAVATWGYSAGGQQAVLDNCPIACGNCPGREAVAASTTCLAQAVRDTYSRVAMAEYGALDSGRVGYLYYGLQGDGSMVQWPSMDWCPTRFDPRYRPWYAAAATGPKRVLMVLDTSGSMCVDPSITQTPAQITAALAIEERVKDAGGDVSGEIVVSLGWSVDVDLDLHVTTPSGTEIFYGRRTADLGQLDVDCLNSPCSRTGGALPVENVAFSPTASDRVLRGTYTIQVKLYGRNTYTGAVGATLTVNAGGCKRIFEYSDIGGEDGTPTYELSYGGVDAPGTTGLMSRMSLARQAANAVLDTLTEADHAGLIAFDGCTLKYADQMQRVTADTKERMHHWVKHLMPGSTTNYAAAFEAAFDVLDAPTADPPAPCDNNTVVIFLTDGRPDAWTDANLARVRERNAAHHAALLTFTLGDDVDSSTTSQLACENEGVYRHVARPGDLDHAMAGYYKYFSASYKGCEGALRWTRYQDAVTCTDLLAGCMPIYAGPGSDELYGVTCMDANLIASLADLEAQSGYAAFEDAYTAQSRTCGSGRRPDLAALRASADAQNAAEGVTAATCASMPTTSATPWAPSGLCTKTNPMSPFVARTCTPNALPASPAPPGAGPEGDEALGGSGSNMIAIVGAVAVLGLALLSTGVFVFRLQQRGAGNAGENGARGTQMTKTPSVDVSSASADVGGPQALPMGMAVADPMTTPAYPTQPVVYPQQMGMAVPAYPQMPQMPMAYPTQQPMMMAAPYPQAGQMMPMGAAQPTQTVSVTVNVDVPIAQATAMMPPANA